MPRCGACSKTGLTCEPFQHQFIFISEKQSKKITKSQRATEHQNTAVRLPRAQDLTNCPLLSSSQSRSNAFEQFLRFNFPDNSSLIESTSHMWASKIRTNQQYFQPLARVACALRTLVLGNRNNDLSLQQHSLELYSKSLASTREAWEHVDRENWLNPSLTVTILFTYEVSILSHTQ